MFSKYSVFTGKSVNVMKIIKYLTYQFEKNLIEQHIFFSVITIRTAEF